ncbi:MAG: bifunctional 4-hydroxy-3-methylbut-2-enyl diphosphate reductase/30S ribosomal protein S1 [Defluviitaleaceae bacterium]|nr:bifunctional 4-hydroxy-3-methylbut-2-enyl diphosphate reductase/30S ribosomal protein S1 [Defluviitaleaceae bacterium]
MDIVLADVYGFCFGVERAVDGALKARLEGDVACLGAITHNKTVLDEMKNAGISIVDTLDEVDEKDDVTVIIRAHGEPPTTYGALKDRGLKYIDFTCPIVLKNQEIAKNAVAQGCKVIITGNKNHPEIVAINGWIGNEAIIVASVAEAGDVAWQDDAQYLLMSQTTFCGSAFDEIKIFLDEKIKNLKIENTICKPTIDRQEAAKSLAEQVDAVIVLGDMTSSNAKKLYDICKKINPNTYFVEKIKNLSLKNLARSDKIGITAGASTPHATIKEALKIMSEFENNVENLENEAGESFADMLQETLTVLRTGQVVTGKVISIVNGEVMVDLQYKSDGIIQRGQFSENKDVNPADHVKPGDEIDVYILRVNDGDGNVLLSKKRVDAQKGYKDIDHAFENKELVLGKIVELVKGGLIVNIGGVRVFVPSSQATARFTKDLSSLVGQELEFEILELNKQKRPWRIIAGRKDIAARQENEAREKALASLAEGMKVTGPVTSVANFGAFIDLGGIDGLIHVSELSWGRIKNPSEVLKVGDVVEAYVIKINPETGKVSLTLKDIANDPWNNIEERYPLGSIVVGKVVRIVPFGAFVELEENLDGLVHISQIAYEHVKNPEDVLTIGQEVEAVIMEMDMEKRKISLSIKEALVVDYDTEDAEGEEAIEGYSSEDYEQEAPVEAATDDEIAE